MSKLIEQIATSMSNFPPEIVVILIACLPLVELRGSLPVAISLYDMGFMEALVLSVIGNMLPVLPLLLLFQPLSKWLSQRLHWYARFYKWLYQRTMRKSDQVKKYGPLGLAIFVAVPIPTTGAWTACLLAILFRIPVWKSFLSICLGIVAAAVIVGLFSHQFLRF